MFSMFSPVMPFITQAFSIQIAELAFEKLIIAARLLLFAKLQTVADDLRLAILAVLAGSEIALFDGALLGVAALAFEE